MFFNKLTVFSVVTIAFIAIIYYKTAHNLPKPNEGNLYYFQCRNNETRVLVSQSQIPTISKGEPLFLVIPGYTESSFREWIHNVSEALRQARPSSCVLIVDHWNYLTFSRPFMTLNVAKIAQDTANFLLDLQAKTGFKFSDIHVVGFSLGGWVSGLISNFLPSEKRLGRITGIDSSFPWTETDRRTEFLDSSDAESVVLIRTSEVSSKIPPVDFDFTVNGGLVQPECLVWWYPDFVQQICSHYKAPLLFITHLVENETSSPSCRCSDRQSLLNGICPCDVKNSFGLNTNYKLKGRFYYES